MRVNLAVVAWLMWAPAALYGLGLRVPDQDAEAVARGNAFVATADNPAAIYYNPAGITQLKGNNLSLGAYGITYSSRYTGAGSVIDTRDTWHALPQFYYTYSPTNRPWAVGLGINSPYGLGVTWPDPSPFRTVATRAELFYLRIAPVAAWQLHPTLTLAAGPTVNYGRADLRRGLLPVNLNDQFKFVGDDIDAGYHLGVRWQPVEKHAFGVTYRSANTMDFTGHSEVTGPPFVFPGSQPASARFKFPQQIAAGWSFRPTPDWNLEFDADWTDWDTLRTVTLRQTPAASLPFNWRSSFLFEWGVTRYFPKNIAVSAGYIYSQNSVPQANFSPFVPDSDRHLLSVGVGQKFTHFQYHAAYQFGYGPSRAINNSSYGPSVAGQYRFLSHALAVSIGYAF